MLTRTELARQSGAYLRDEPHRSGAMRLGFDAPAPTDALFWRLWAVTQVTNTAGRLIRQESLTAGTQRPASTRKRLATQSGAPLRNDLDADPDSTDVGFKTPAPTST